MRSAYQFWLLKVSIYVILEQPYVISIHNILAFIFILFAPSEMLQSFQQHFPFLLNNFEFF